MPALDTKLREVRCLNYVGTEGCPQYGIDGVQQQQSSPPWDSVEIASTEELYSFVPDDILGGNNNKSADIDWEGMYYNSDVGLRGRIIDADIFCMTDNIRQMGVGWVRLFVDEVYWGPVETEMEIWIEGVSIPDCVIYTPSHLYYSDTDFHEGAEFLVFGWGQNGALVSNSRYSFKISSNDKASLDLNSLRVFAESTAAIRQAQEAELVALLRQTQDKQNLYAVERIIRQPSVAVDEYLSIDEIVLLHISSVYQKDDRPPLLLCYLQKSHDGGWKLFDAQKSVYVITNDAVITASGLNVGARHLAPVKGD